MAKILVIEKEQKFYDLLEDDLIKQNHHQVIRSFDSEDILDKLKNDNIDVALIQLEKDNNTILTLIAKIREFNTKVRIIILCEKDDELGIVKALNNGATTYMIKPILLRRLMAQINALLVDISYFLKEKHIGYINKDVKIDFSKREVYLKNDLVELTKLEYDLLSYLFNNNNKVLSRNNIMTTLWNYEYDKNNRSVDVYIHSLRRKLNLDKEIINKRSVGYILNID